jgi:hypothetical protein
MYRNSNNMSRLDDNTAPFILPALDNPSPRNSKLKEGNSKRGSRFDLNPSGSKHSLAVRNSRQNIGFDQQNDGEDAGENQYQVQNRYPNKSNNNTNSRVLLDESSQKNS